MSGSIVIIILGLMVWLTPVVWHIRKLVLNQRDYNFTQVRTEIDWLELRGGIFNKLSIVRRGLNFGK